ncbi:MAG: aminoglycoside phosphotransferase family protein [Candidatus Micrarchaeota archaeon]|nr:aminoglycoside phosphotransferase family protein [Candidatus Micrarchaeota archaeon]
MFMIKTDIMPNEIKIKKNHRVLKKSCIEHLRSVCAKIFATTPQRISFFSSGFLHQIYEIELEKGTSIIVKINTNSHKYAGPCFLLDKIVGQEIKKIGLSSASIFKIDISRRYCKFDYEILEKLNEKKIAEISNPQEFLDAITKLGKTCKIYHLLSYDGFGPINLLYYIDKKRIIGCYNKWEEYVLLNLQKHLSYCRKYNIIKEDNMTKIIRKFEYKEYLNVDKGSLLHGDLANHNAFLHPRRNIILIDWEDCIIGDPIYDIAYWSSFIQNEPKNVQNAFIDGYGNKNSINGDWMIKFWLYYLRIAIAKTVHRHKFNYRTLNEYKISKAMTKLQELGI